jgi:hypothetical protein
MRVCCIFQFGTQVVPPSVEKACSQAALSVPGVQVKRTSIGWPSQTSGPSKMPVPSSRNEPVTGVSSWPRRLLIQ